MKKNNQLLFFLFTVIFPSSIGYAENNSELSYIKKRSFYEEIPNTKKGGTLHLPIGSDPKVMNPLLSDDTASTVVEGYLWLPLFSRDPETLDFIPNLAKHFHVSADKRNYTFTLYENAKWQDGSPVTAEDVKFTLDTMLDTKTHASALRTFYEGVSLNIIDKQKFTFTVKEPKFDTFNALALFTPIQKKQFANTTNFNTDKGIMNPVGNAAYIFDKFIRSQKIIFKRNKDWWAKDLPQFKNRFNPDEIILNIIPDPNLTYEKFLKGDIDQISFTPEQWNNKVTKIDKEKFGKKQNEREIWSLKVANKFPKPYSFIAWNLKNSLFNDVKTRTALSHLVDYNRINDKVYFNLYTRSTSPFGSFTGNSAPELRKAENLITYNKEKAFSLLKEAGWKNDGSGVLVREVGGKKQKFEFNLDINSNNVMRQKIAEIVRENFKVAGIKVNIRSYEWNTFLQLINNRNFDALILGWTGSLFPNAKQIWHSDSEKNGGSNFVSYSNKKVDDLIKKSNLEFDPEKRYLLMQEINRIIYQDQPYTFIAEVNFVLEGLNSKIFSPRWTAMYESGAASDLFYLVQ